MFTSSSSKSCSRSNSASVARARSQRWQLSAWKTVTLGIQAPRHRRLGDALDGQAVRRQPHAQVARLVHVPRFLERLVDDLLELRVDLVLLPEVLLEALHPLEVGD